MTPRSPRASRSPLVALGLILILTLGEMRAAPPVAAGSPPDPPVITTPATTNVGAEDVHMEMGAPFRATDGDSHAASDWEIRTGDGATVVWATYDSSVLVHAHFGDGAFMGPLTGQRRLNYGTPYLFRVRYKDSGGDYSEWSERAFTTSRQVQIPAQQVIGILTQPAPTWRTDGDAPIGLPAGARLTLESGGGEALLALDGAGDGLTVTPGGILTMPDVLRLRLSAPAEQGLILPSSRLTAITLLDQGAKRLTAYLPSLMVEAGQERVLWVTETGATFYGTAEEQHPNRARLARDTSLPWDLPPGYRLAAVNAGLQMPTSLAFVPDPGADPAAPRLYVTELYGRIKVITNDGRTFTFADGLLNVNPEPVFPGQGEMGVIGVCLEPNARNVYATMIYRDQAGSLRNKIVRIRSSDGLRADGVDDILVVKAGQGLARASHQIQQCSFGPDGKLYVFVADGPDPAVAQDDKTLNGKVLRLNPDGSAPADNPKYDPANPTAPISYQYTKGHRNAFGMTWRQADNGLYLAENGPDVDRLVKATPGRNYGWDGTNDSMRTAALYVWPEGAWSPVGLAFAEGANAAGLGPDKQGKLFVGSAGQVYAAGPQRRGKVIQEFTLDPDGSITQPPAIFGRYVGEGKGSIADVKLRPDGLYFTDLYLDDGEGGPSAPGGKLWRISYTGAASFTASATSGAAPLTVSFTDTSDLPAASARSWDFGDGDSGVADGAAQTHTFTQPGRYAVTLTGAGRDGTPVDTLVLVTVTDPSGVVPAPAAEARPAPMTPAPQAIFFPETGVVLGGGFKLFWERNGGLTAFGYPITREFQERNPADGQVYTVQYFERARFEYHPENKGTPYETQLGLIGTHLAGRRLTNDNSFQRLTGGALASTSDRQVFEATAHSLSGPFLQRWQAGGGVDIYGLPISEPFTEALEFEGDGYLVQYFERARMEYHPEAAGTVDEIRLYRLGTALFTRRPSARVS